MQQGEAGAARDLSALKNIAAANRSNCLQYDRLVCLIGFRNEAGIVLSNIVELDSIQCSVRPETQSIAPEA